jgi:hypothetical protein
MLVTELMMSYPQSKYIYKLTGYDVDKCGLTYREASKIIQNALANLPTGVENLPNAVNARVLKQQGIIMRRPEPKTKNVEFQKIWDEAHEAGMKALTSCEPVPMVVSQHENMLDDKSPVQQSWYVADGVCGFAWIKITPATQPFARWCKVNKGLKKSYTGGYDIWVHEGGQSMQRKESYARAFVRVLKAHNIECYSQSRMD